ncbi:bifunctional tRNA (adenosine(37)-N6)-threonylcarbamoyltransferase complex ATPase subunit type 1 TsaE/phosphotransferase [Bradyrhizobium sp. SSBR45G]|uniref:tRNA (adenosine(37)-N6)-threonylcarbamoyltransferase complex ATPase subunit type 1 TsaE n=1 Tax=unclassified Bradyrhizobium TaxID=2631580 RepID=UPI002342B3F7|nr:MULTISPECIES: tRNA (adenosine(37)-N6)-threonylcarbamoyltransferase complex ATPase subunit type 1 TsaE [unclassified Bradyrhizobium]GLH77729.1 bifunctional tRNA (adenosine(37)-N6)-threonylcarbamoyltransferase complex ATPase subunit type 1 TsaE/phosphotransferase [Bradyrhizobium sp. SSBR45G]GLH84966.1 bifunctional tRNA (adenosine(37)-N6)-threonylcarbamoyltransferase complex ATPase subunit type 1 TsaE/phosphotransferase [Bradyrhizobium sp. SSBR45R]
MTDQLTFTVALADEAATAALMADLALLIGPGALITLTGDLGAGKTAAARAMIRYLADDSELEVPSPTFTLAQSYDLPSFPLVHADLYRISDASELEEIGLSPLPDATVVLIEWPERAGGALPSDRIDIALRHDASQGDSARSAEITGTGKASTIVARLKALREFLAEAGHARSRRERMAGDASTRSYARLHKGERVSILMNSPKRPDGPAIYDGKSYSGAVHLAEDVRPFVAMAGALRARGISAPKINDADLDNGFLVTEDLGREGVIEGDPPRPIVDRYEAATDLLAALHAQDVPSVLPLAPQVTYKVPTFDVDAMLVEIGLMLEWYLPDRDAEPSQVLRAEFLELWRDLLDGPLAAKPTWVIRDYHSPNLLWLPARAGIARVGVIDFQDAVMGPPAYDVVSLAQDARIDVPADIEQALLARYIAARQAASANFDADEFGAHYAIMSAQRNTRLLGTFARLNRRDGKPHYLKHQPRIWDYLHRSLAHTALDPIRDWYAANVPPPAGMA